MKIILINSNGDINESNVNSYNDIYKKCLITYKIIQAMKLYVFYSMKIQICVFKNKMLCAIIVVTIFTLLQIHK